MVKTKLLLDDDLHRRHGLRAGTRARRRPAAPRQPPAAPADLSVKQRPTLTPAEMVNQSKEYFKGDERRPQAHPGTLQDQAKREKDIIRLNCVTDKLVQARVNVNIAEQSMATHAGEHRPRRRRRARRTSSRASPS